MTSMHEGRVALVTGAAQGLGRGFAVRLAADGAAVIAADRADCGATVDTIRAAGGRAESVVCDLSEAAAVERLADVAGKSFGPCDILVNNAGVFPNQALGDIDAASWRAVMAVNLDAPFVLSRALAAGMSTRGWGRIINISSATVATNGPGSIHYVTSKMGLIGLTRALATALGPSGITVNAVAPGLVRTEGTAARFAEDAKDQPKPVDVYAFYAARQAIKHTLAPDDIAGAVSFLASPAAGFITGQTLFVDGGVVRV